MSVARKRADTAIDFNCKRVADPVHGSIGLSELETRIIGTKAFLRLQNVKHLGLAYFVFPGADFSRFSHALGACQVTGRLLHALRQNSTAKIDRREVQLYRLAALLHDIGHLPFSHPMERAVKNYYGGAIYEERGEPGAAKRAGTAPADSKLHEHLGSKILAEDPELSSILCQAGFAPEEVSSVFTRTKPPRFSNLVNSDLDADRIDYLLRMGHHTGLPYGHVDLEYLLSQMRIDDQNRVCLDHKALRTAEHFLLLRYFAYQQIVYHKTVVALELVLEDLLRSLLARHYLKCSMKWVSKAIQSGEWYTFDDTYILQCIRKLRDGIRKGKVTKGPEVEADTLLLKAESVLHRKPPKLVGSAEQLDERDSGTSAKSFHERGGRLLRERKKDWAQAFEVNEKLWYVWDIPGCTLTTIGSHVEVSAAFDRPTGEKDTEKAARNQDMYWQAVRVLKSPGHSKAIMEFDGSLMKILADQALYVQRVYALLPSDAPKELRDQIQRRVGSDEPALSLAG